MSSDDAAHGINLPSAVEASRDGWIAARSRASHRTGPERRVLRLGKDLDRDVSPEARVARAVNLSHAALAERTEDLEAAEPGTLFEGHGL
jgi:hypothetical protein